MTTVLATAMSNASRIFGVEFSTSVCGKLFLGFEVRAVRTLHQWRKIILANQELRLFWVSLGSFDDRLGGYLPHFAVG